MSAKIQKLGELETLLCNNDKTDEGLLHFFFAFKTSGLLKCFNNVKTKGYTVSSLILMLIMFRLRGINIWASQKACNKGMAICDDNTYYRLMNHPLINWRKMVIAFAKQFMVISKTKGDDVKNVKCFVIDDTDLEKTGRKIEFIGKIFNHVIKKHVLGFKMLTLAFWDGKSLIATDFSLHREAGKKGNYGMSKKELKNQFSKKRDIQSPAQKRVAELDKKKTDVAISMLKRAVKNGFVASYVLVDSWFTNEMFIKSVRSIKNRMMHFLGMCKIDRRKFNYEGKDLNSTQIIAAYSRKKGKYCRKYKSHYFSTIAVYKGEKVKLFYVKYGKSKNWSLLLTTNLVLSFVEAIELYQIRWTIEVMFKECKQYLAIGSSQNTDFDGQIADTSIALITHTILSLQKRFSDYETMGELFRQTQQQFLELTLWDRLLKVFKKMLQELAIIFDIDVDEILEQLMQNNKISGQLFSILKFLDDDNCHFEKESAA